ncbi:MAG: HAD family hydrolase, partial [Planctomycetota bacterium]
MSAPGGPRLSREEAWSLLCEWTKGEPLRKHALAVETVMRAAASLYGPGPEAADSWGIAGMLHDADYE